MMAGRTAGDNRDVQTCINKKGRSETVKEKRDFTTENK